jgi:hypothetical protein
MDILTRSVAIVRQSRVVLRELAALRRLINEPKATAADLERYAQDLLKETGLRFDA